MGFVHLGAYVKLPKQGRKFTHSDALMKKVKEDTLSSKQKNADVSSAQPM
jgi:hypothetical protein